jgi:hypothetical protein
MARNGTGRGQELNRMSLASVGSLGGSPYSILVTERTALYNRIMVRPFAPVKSESL